MTLAETDAGYRVLETSHPPVYYFPPTSIDFELLKAVENKHSFCEFKGTANYWRTRKGNIVLAWSYPKPNLTFLPIKDYLAFYPSKVEACFVDGERVRSQDGDFYGGWITQDIVGPFKGGAETWGW